MIQLVGIPLSGLRMTNYDYNMKIFLFFQNQADLGKFINVSCRLFSYDILDKFFICIYIFFLFSIFFLANFLFLSLPQEKRNTDIFRNVYRCRNNMPFMNKTLSTAHMKQTYLRNRFLKNRSHANKTAYLKQRNYRNYFFYGKQNAITMKI